MSLTMYDYYLSQPEYMKSILAKRDAYLGKFSSFYAGIQPDRIYLCGSGTSFHACNSSLEYMETLLGQEITVISPGSLKSLCGKKPLVIAVSQGGRSTNTLAAMDICRKKGIPVAALTQSASTPVAHAADCALILGVDDETAGPKTRGYTGTVLSLYLMALTAAFETGAAGKNIYDKRLNDLITIADMGETNQKLCRDFFDRFTEPLKRANNYMFAGKGVSAKVAGEMALKEQETLCYPASGYEFEEYLHGPACCTDEGTALFLFPSGDADDGRMRRLSEIVSTATDNVYFITFDGHIQGERVLCLQTSDRYFMPPFSSIFFAQLLSALMPEICGRGRHAAVKNIFATMDTKVPAEQAK
jgi:glucoselysine-6-phosphate deglycase